VPDVLLAGAFGQGNPGDEALLSAFLGALPPGRVAVTSRDPRATEARHRCDAFEPRAPAALRELRRADAVVVGGGTVFKTLHPSTGRGRHALLTNTTLLIHGARVLGKPVLMIGVGAGNLASHRSQRLSRTLVRAADALVLRDEESAEVLTGIGAPTPFRVGADPAWTLLDDGPVRSEQQPGDAVVVALSHLAGGPELPRVVAEWVRVLQAAGLRVSLQPWQVNGGDGDHRLARQVKARVHVEVLDPPADLADARHSIAGAALVLGMRFHALMAAAAAGVRFVAVDHELKLGALARRFSQRAVAPTEAPERMADAVAGALAGPPPGVSELLEQIALAEEGFRLLRLVLEGGAPDPDELRGLPLEPASWDVPR